MKKTISLIFLLAFIITGCNKGTTNSTSVIDNDNNKQAINKETSSNNKICSWIDDSDVVIKLDLPEEYAHYNDANIYPSYEVGLMFRSSYGDIASSRRLARKGCDYRVGFSKEDFADINSNPNYPLVILALKDSSTDFSYDSEPIKLTFKDGLPEQGNEFVLKITGEVPSFGHYDGIFK